MQTQNQGSLGIRPIKAMNQAQLAKWLWCLGDDSIGLWKQIISSKYNVSRGGWEVHGGCGRLSGIWKGILSFLEPFSQSISYHVGKGDRVRIWLDTCIGDSLLATQFLNLVQCA